MFRAVALKLLIRFIELFLIIRREAALIFAHIHAWRITIGCGDRIEGRVLRNVITLHQFFHVACVFVDIVAIIFCIRLFPLGVLLVEFVLIVGRHLIVISAIVVARIIVVGWRRRDFVLRRHA